MKTPLAYFLFFLAAWTLVIKFIFPIAFSLAYGLDVMEHIFWDFWWVVHIILGWAMLRPPTKPLGWVALSASIAEIFIVTIKFYFFLSSPEWTIWRTNWFINKIFVLIIFILLLIDLIRNWQNYQGKSRKAYHEEPYQAPQGE